MIFLRFSDSALGASRQKIRPFEYPFRVATLGVIMFDLEVGGDVQGALAVDALSMGQ